MMGSLSGGLATMGAGVPYAIAAKFAYPDRPVIALVGDGAMQMNGINEMITVAKYWKGWSNPHLIFMVMNNRDLNQVTWKMRVQAGDPKFEATQSIPDALGTLATPTDPTAGVSSATTRRKSPVPGTRRWRRIDR